MAPCACSGVHRDTHGPLILRRTDVMKDMEQNWDNALSHQPHTLHPHPFLKPVKSQKYTE